MNWHARISPKRLIIAAASARPFVRAAAVAGFEVIAADVFCDEDTRRNAFQAVALGYAQGGFDAHDIRQRLMPLLEAGNAAFAYGSGFENQPELLDEIARHCPVVGNDAEVVGAVKDPGRFFLRLAMLGIPHPETLLHSPLDADGWLRKRIGGSGGTHVTLWGTADVGHYFQRRLPGKPVSLLFLANGRNMLEVGVHEQWLAPTGDMPYRYGGAVSQAEVPPGVHEGMRAAAQQLTAEFGLRGLNSLDCMVAGDDWWVLEINPRLSASFGLYDAADEGANLLRAHIEACRGHLALQLPSECARAHLIYYPAKEQRVPPDLQWPAWVADMPVAGTRVAAGEPLCSVTASAESVHAAKLLAWQRAERLTQLFS